MLKTLAAFLFAFWSLAAPAMAAENLRDLDDAAPKAAHCALMSVADDEAPASSDLPDCCRVPAPLLTELMVATEPFTFEPVRFDPIPDDRVALYASRPELPPPRA